jgi:hypothetical protein
MAVFFSNFSDLFNLFDVSNRRTIFSNMKTMGENETVGAQVLVAIVFFICVVARAFLLFIKVVLLSWDLTTDCKRAFQHVNNNENKKASVPIHSIQPYGLLFSVGDISEKLKEWCARVFSLLRFYLLGQQQKDLFKNSTWIKFPWVQNSLLRRIPALGPLH